MNIPVLPRLRQPGQDGVRALRGLSRLTRWVSRPLSTTEPRSPTDRQGPPDPGLTGNALTVFVYNVTLVSSGVSP